MTKDLGALRAAWQELQALPFPEHPGDDLLASWVLELAELDGHIAGLARTALGSRGARTATSKELEAHGASLQEIAVTGDDLVTYNACVTYVSALQRVEHALGNAR